MSNSLKFIFYQRFSELLLPCLNGNFLLFNPTFALRAFFLLVERKQTPPIPAAALYSRSYRQQYTTLWGKWKEKTRLPAKFYVLFYVLYYFNLFFPCSFTPHTIAIGFRHKDKPEKYRLPKTRQRAEAYRAGSGRQPSAPAR